MSTQRGNNARSRTQKYQNRTVFKNNLHDTSHRTKLINSTQVSDVCIRCKEIIEWKIKYKKYKPLTQPKKCCKCGEKTVRKAYHVMCTDCGAKLKVCTKCCQSKDIVPAVPNAQEQLKLDAEMQKLLQSLPERKRRTFLRYMNSMNKKDKEGIESNKEKQKEDLVTKLNALKVDDNNSDLDFSDFEDEGDVTSSN